MDTATPTVAPVPLDADLAKRHGLTDAARRTLGIPAPSPDPTMGAETDPTMEQNQ